MVEVMRNLVSRAKNSKFPGICPELSDDDVVQIWELVAEFIEKQMMQQKGVQVPGLGVFSFSQHKLDVGNNKFLLLQRPVFQISEKLAQTHQLNINRIHLTGSIPVIPLNYSSLSLAGPFSRDVVESVVREVLQSLSRALAAGQNVELTLVGIGRLKITNLKVKMKFYKHFINSVDGSGQLEQQLRGRPGTADSVMTDRSCSRAMSGANTVTLPRIKSTPELAPIDEEEGPKDTTAAAAATTATEKEPEQQCTIIQDSSPQRPTFPVAQVAAVSFDDELQTQNTNMNHAITPNSPEGFWPASPASELKKPMPPQSSRGVTPPHSRGVTRPASECGHCSTAGQELCYLCHQRSRRNIPVSFNEERKKREEEEDRLLNEYRHLKDIEYVQQEQELDMAKRHELQKAAAFNLGVAEANKVKVKNATFTPSYIFQRRALTPPRFIKQKEYQRDLETLVRVRQEAESKTRSDESFLERIEQVQLAEDLAAQRALLARQRAEQRGQYQQALDTQVTMKPAQIPARVPNSTEPMVAGDYMSPEKVLARRRLAHQLFKEQKETVEQRKRTDVLKKLNEQQQEENMLKRTKEELLADRIQEFERVQKQRQMLEHDWLKALQQKRLREEEDKSRHRESGELYHEICDRYKRCGQCQRRLTNSGETNLWKESYYIPGARIII